MGQFASRHYDGDPYIELMRALPDRELIWWVQKVIWLAEGMTFADHFFRTYPSLFLHHCPRCNGAGSVTCPHCGGYKVRRRADAAAAAAGAGSLQLSSMAAPRRRLAAAPGEDECDRCGAYCDWDAESEWEHKWSKWESRLAYYDRTYGRLLDEWYEDVINEGNLDADTPHEEPDPPAEGDTGLLADIDRRGARNKKLVKALLKRYGGHPYERGDLLDFKTIDPSRPLADNLAALGYNANELPPELSPLAFPELVADPQSALADFDRQIQMEALLSRNLEAALQDKPKPYSLGATAGTVPCPSCSGQPWAFAIVPNWGKLTHTEPPFWVRTAARMSQYGLRPDERAAAAVEHYLEYPQRSAAAAAAEAPLEKELEEAAARGAARGAGWRALALGASPEVVARAAMEPEPLLKQGGKDGGSSSSSRELKARRRAIARAASGGAWWLLPGEPHPVYGSSDPLSCDELKALPPDAAALDAWQRSALDGATPLAAGGAWRAAAGGAPGRALAARVRARRLEAEAAAAAGGELERELARYHRARDLGAPSDDGDSGGGGGSGGSGGKKQQQQRRRGGGQSRVEAALVADAGGSGSGSGSNAKKH